MPTKAKPRLFPPGNGRVGDYVWYWPPGLSRKEHPLLGHIDAVGFQDHYGDYRDIRVKPREGKKFFSPTYSPLGRRQCHIPIIVPPPGRLREESAGLTNLFYTTTGNTRYMLYVARLPTNNSKLRYRLVCKRCWGEVRRKRTLVEDADFTLVKGQDRPYVRFWEGKRAAIAVETVFACDCRKGPDERFVEDLMQLEADLGGEELVECYE